MKSSDWAVLGVFLVAFVAITYLVHDWMVEERLSPEFPSNDALVEEENEMWREWATYQNE